MPFRATCLLLIIASIVAAGADAAPAARRGAPRAMTTPTIPRGTWEAQRAARLEHSLDAFFALTAAGVFEDMPTDATAKFFRAARGWTPDNEKAALADLANGPVLGWVPRYNGFVTCIRAGLVADPTNEEAARLAMAMTKRLPQATTQAASSDPTRLAPDPPTAGRRPAIQLSALAATEFIVMRQRWQLRLD